MLCVNSYKQGKVIELRLADGHVLILGRNGAGKTTLAQLIPLFYGVPASHIVDRSGGRSPITEFLLKGRASYIVFEYRRHDDVNGEDDLRTVVLRSDDEGRMVYQFFRGGYDQRLFITDGRTYRDYADLRAAATSLGMRASELLNNADYTKVIQNLPAGTRRADQISTLAADYACVEAGHNLRHLEKIVGSMFKESAGFDDFQRIVISALKLRTDKPTRELQLGKSEIYAWRDQRIAYLDVMSHAKQMETAKSEAATLEELSHEIGLARAQASRLRARTATALDDEEAKLTKEEHDHRIDMADLGPRKKKRSDELDETRRKLKTAREELEELASRGRYFDDQEVQRCASEVENDLPSARTRYTEAMARRTALLGQQSTIDNEFERLITARQQAALAEVRLVNDQMEKARLKAEDEKRAVDLDEAAQLRGIEESLQAELAPRVARRDDLAGERATHIARFQNPVATDETVARIDAVETEQETAQDDWQDSERELSTAEGLERAARKQYDEAELQVATLRRQEVTATKEVADLEEQIRPRDDSLLAFLRSNLDGWEGTVGKVIDPKLYHRDDLRPIVRELGSNTVLGVELDIAAIAADPALSVEALKAAKVRAEQVLDAVLNRLAKGQEAQRVAGDALKSAGERVTLAKSEKGRLDTLFQQQREQLKGLKDKRTRELAECRDAALKGRTDAETALATFDKETATIKGAYNQRNGDVGEEASRKRRVIDKVRDDDLLRLDETLKAIATTEATDVQTLTQDKLARLQQNGIDPDKLKQVDQQVQAQDAEVKRIEKLQSLVSDWKVWKERAAKREPKLRSEIGDLEVVEIKQGISLEEIVRYETDAILKHDNVMKAAEKEIDRLRAVLRSCDMLPIFVASDIPSSLRPFPEAANESVLVTVATLETKAGTLVAGYRDSIQRLRASIGLVRSAMMNAHHSVIRDFYDQTDAAKSDDPLIWVKDLWQWFDIRHQEMRQTLVETAKNTAGQIRNFYNELKEFNREVGRFNDSLQTGLKRKIMVDEAGRNRFDKLTDLDVVVTSSLAEEKLWGPLEAFIDHLDSQAGRLRDNDVPSDEFVAALTRVLSAWGSDSSMKVELSNQVRIRGEVVENSNRKKFASAAEFKSVSSSGLSCIVLMAVLCGFVHMVRGSSKAIVTWAIDETGRLDARNIRGMLDVLKDNNIRLVTATPELPKRSMQQFDCLVQVTDEREVFVAKVPDAMTLTAKFRELTANV